MTNETNFKKNYRPVSKHSFQNVPEIISKENKCPFQFNVAAFRQCHFAELNLNGSTKDTFKKQAFQSQLQIKGGFKNNLFSMNSTF